MGRSMGTSAGLTAAGNSSIAWDSSSSRVAPWNRLTVQKVEPLCRRRKPATIMTTAVKTKVHNYSAGPCILPPEVFEQAAQAVLDFQGSGLSIPGDQPPQQALRGGDGARPRPGEGAARACLKGTACCSSVAAPAPASTSLRPTSFEGGLRGLRQHRHLGHRGRRRGAEHQPREVVASGEADDFTRIPKGLSTIPQDAGTTSLHQQQHHLRRSTRPSPMPERCRWCDTSSDIFSRPVNVADFAMIYAGAQKHEYLRAPRYIVKEEPVLVIRAVTGLHDGPPQIIIKKESMFRPVFPVYVSMLTLNG